MLFNINSIVILNDQEWVVVGYHKVEGTWKVQLRNLETQEFIMVPTKDLESYL